jgi:hypothetical protein
MRQFYTIHGKNINKIKQKGKNLNTSNTQSLIQYVRNNTFPSGVAILSHVTSTASVGDFRLLIRFFGIHHLVFDLGSLGNPSVLILSEIHG